MNIKGGVNLRFLWNFAKSCSLFQKNRTTNANLHSWHLSCQQHTESFHIHSRPIRALIPVYVQAPDHSEYLLVQVKYFF